MTVGTGSFLNTSHQTVKWFAQESVAGRLIVRPSFQRRPVWSDDQKSLLVDTILRGYPVPEIYVFMIEHQDRDDAVAVVDGQQRIRACLEYMADGFPINFDVAKLAPVHGAHDTPWMGLRFSKLSPDQRKNFERYKLIVRDLAGVDEPIVRHIFHRLNQSNVALNQQELRFSMYEGGLLATVERLAKHDAWNQFRIFTVQQRRRMADSEYISELVLAHLHWPQNKKDGLDQYYRLYANAFPFEHEVTRRFTEVLESLQKAFPKPRLNGTRWYRKSDFYTLFLALTRGRIPLPESAEEREGLARSLSEFSALVSGSQDAADGSPVAVYRDAVTRAATDRARRIRREDALVAAMEHRDRVYPEGEPDPEPDEMPEPEGLSEEDETEEDVDSDDALLNSPS